MKQCADFRHKFDKSEHEHCIRYRVILGHKVQNVISPIKGKGKIHPTTGYEGPEGE